MVDFPNPSTFPIQPASQTFETWPDTEPRRKKPRAAKKLEKVEEAEDQESDEEKHSLDLDA